MAAIPTGTETDDDAAETSNNQVADKTHDPLDDAASKYEHLLNEIDRKRTKARAATIDMAKGGRKAAKMLKEQANSLKEKARRLRAAEIRRGNEEARGWKDI